MFLFVLILIKSNNFYQSVMITTTVTTTQQGPITLPDKNTKGIIFAVLLLCFEIMTCFIYGFRYSYNPINSSSYSQGDVVVVVVLIILAIVGFALMNSYITNVSFSGMAMSLLIFAVTIQHYFFVRAFWYKAGTPLQSSVKTWGDTDFNRISFVNVGQDAYAVDDFFTASWADAIACAICMILTFTPVVGRIQFLEATLLSLVGAWIYEVNVQLFYRLRISDCGFGMRVFLFAGIMGRLTAFLLGKKDTTINHSGFYSSYSSRGIALMGFVFTFCAFPFLCVAGLYNTSQNRGFMAYVGTLNMYLALGAGVLGSFSSNALTYRKINTFDLIFTGLSGGIAYSSSADLHRNPGIPLGVGFLTGFAATIFHSRIFRRGNKNGVLLSLGTVERLILPGVMAGILSAVLQAIGQASYGLYIHSIPSYRSAVGQGAFQLIGILLTVGIAAFAGVLVGLLYKIINKNQPYEQFNDNVLYRADEDHWHYTLGKSWKQIQ